MAQLTLALRRSSRALPEPTLYIEGEGSLGAVSPEDFGVKLRRYLDHLERLKFLDHLAIAVPNDLPLEEKSRCEQYARVARMVVQDIRNSVGSPEDSLLGLKNFFVNLPLLLEKPHLSQLQVKKPFRAVVAASGPSLELEYENLRKIQNEILILCPDASLHALLDHGVTPHIVVAMERDDSSRPFFENLPQDLKTLLIGQSLIPKDFFDLFPGPIATVDKFSGPYLWLQLGRPQLWSASSSAHTCYRVAAYLGAHSIALVGQDLAYHPTSFQSHSALGVYDDWSKPKSIEQRIKEEKAFFVSGNTHEKVLTNDVWDHFAHDYLVLIDECKIPTVNTSVLGRQIGSLAFHSLRDWIAAGSDTQLNFQFPKENSQREQDTQKAKARLKQGERDLELLLAQVKQASSAPSTLYKSIVQAPSFLELVLEVMFSDFVRTENLCFAEPESSAKFHQEFLTQAALRISQVLQMLRLAKI